MKHLIIDPIRCTGCNSCALTCSFVSEGFFDLSKSRIRVQKNAERAEATPKVCIQCEEAPCISACPVQALSRDRATGAIHVDDTLCTGCRACIAACPYDGVGFDEDSQLPLICNLCDGDPECVKHCQFAQAIRYATEETEE